MAKKSSTIDQEQTQNKPKQASREEIDAALARLQKVAENLPPVDAVEIVREGRMRLMLPPLIEHFLEDVANGKGE